jgi:predicted transcriptional regulator
MLKSKLPARSKIDVALLSQEQFTGYSTITDVTTLVQQLKNFIKKKKTLIFLDGVHYLITKFSFEQFIDAFYQINDLIAQNRCLLLLYVNPSILTETQRAIIENECQKLPSQKIEGIILEDSVYTLLKFIYEQNQNNALISYKKVMAHFKIAYSTAAKRLDELENKGLILTKKQGKLRTVSISEKGKNLLHRRQTA